MAEIPSTVPGARSVAPRAVLGARPLSAHAVEFICFALVAAVYAAHLFISGYSGFYYDSWVYWALGSTFEHNGHFSLTSFNPNGYPRGYSLPLLNHVLHDLAALFGIGSVAIVKLFGALLAATLGVIVAPRLARRLFSRAEIGLGRILALNAIVFLFWRDHFDFPLTDFPALLVACVGLLWFLRGTPAGYLVAGLGFALAENLRPAYQPALILVVLAAAIFPIRGWQLRPRAAATGLVLAGALVAFLPQVAINHHQHGSWSPFVLGGKTIALLQLSDGMVAQKYETYVGDPAAYPQPQVFYLDPSTIHVLQREGLPSSTITPDQTPIITSYGQYAHVVLHNPAEMASSYLRHVFNGLDVRYSTPYIRNLDDTSIVLSLVEYALLFAALARLLLSNARHALGRVRWLGVVLLVSPCLTAIPGAVEPRFFLPAQLLVYMLVCFGPATRGILLGETTARRAAMAAAFCLFLLVCVTLSSATLSNLQLPGPTLGAGAVPARLA